jgi:hypothetical protein
MMAFARADAVLTMLAEVLTPPAPTDEPVLFTLARPHGHSLFVFLLDLLNFDRVCAVGYGACTLRKQRADRQVPV